MLDCFPIKFTELIQQNQNEIQFRQLNGSCKKKKSQQKQLPSLVVPKRICHTLCNRTVTCSYLNRCVQKSKQAFLIIPTFGAHVLVDIWKRFIKLSELFVCQLVVEMDELFVRIDMILCLKAVQFHVLPILFHVIKSHFTLNLHIFLIQEHWQRKWTGICSLFGFLVKEKNIHIYI